MGDLGDDIERIEGLADKRLSILGYRFTPTQLVVGLGILGSVIGTLYSGFLMYQKVESIANLDVEAFDQRMQVMEAKMEEVVDYSRDIKNGLRDDILRIEQQTDRTEDMVRDTESKVRTLIDDAEIRFETKREQLRMSQQADLKELEDRLNQKVQRALDNPLAD